MPTLRQYKYRYLINRGLTHLESLELSRQYTLQQIRSLPYIRTLLLSRRRSIMNWRNAGYTERNIQGAIANQYWRNRWLTPDNKFDPWSMLRRFRDASIDSGDYTPPPKKKYKGVSRGDIEGQKRRAKTRQHIASIKQKIADLNQAVKTVKDDSSRRKFIRDRDSYLRELKQG